MRRRTTTAIANWEIDDDGSLLHGRAVLVWDAAHGALCGVPLAEINGRPDSLKP